MFDIDFIKSLEDAQRSNFYRAKVVSLDDPLHLNRVQINIFGLTDDFPYDPDEIAMCPLPWCEFQFTAGFSTYPIVGDIIWLFFEGGDIFRPIYLGTIYAGTDIDTDPGYEKFATNLGATEEASTASLGTSSTGAGFDFSAVKDPTTYRAALRSANRIESNKRLVLQDVISTYDVLTRENTWWRAFVGLEKVKVGDCAPGEGDKLHGLDPDYGTCPYPPGEKMYPWYELKENAPNDWKSVYGGWRFYTEDQLKQGLGKFPDNVQRTYLKRYRNWAKWTVQRSLKTEISSPDEKLYAKACSKDWTFLPMAATLYSDPELAAVSFSRDLVAPEDPPRKAVQGKLHTEYMQGLCSIKPSPFSTMKITDRKHYKQSTWLSYDGKSAVELDDNDNYERLRLDYNYSEGGLEFSRVGWHGLNIWTEGSFKIRAWGRQADGKGEGMFNPSHINCIDHNLNIDAKSLYLTGNQNAGLTGTKSVAVRCKKGVTSVSGGEGVFIQSETGNSVGEGTTDANRGSWMGTPVISAPAGNLTSKMQGWFLYLPGPEITDGDAAIWKDLFNVALLTIKSLCTAIMTDSPKLIMVAPNTILTASAALDKLKDWKIESQVPTVTKFAGAWAGVQIEGSQE